MVATPMAPTKRYFRPGTTKILIVDDIADIFAPLRSELDAGTDVSAETFDIEGFMVQSNTLPTEDFGSRFTGRIPSDIVSEDSALITYADTQSVDIRTVITRDQLTNVVFMDEGDVAGLLMDVFPVRVSATPKLRVRADPARIRAQFTVLRLPAENITIP